MPEVLPIALGHLDHCLRHLDELTAAVLLALPATLAHGERHLITRPGFVPRAFEDAATEEQDGRVIVECFARFARDLGHGFAEARERFAGDLEAEHVTPGARIGDIARAASGTMARHELFHLAHRAPPCRSEPLALRHWHCHARELPHGGEAEGPRLELFGCLGQRFECLSDPELIVREARAVAEEPLGVLVKGAVSELAMGSRAERPQEPAPFLEVEPRALDRESNELFVSAPPGDVSGNAPEPTSRC